MRMMIVFFAFSGMAFSQSRVQADLGVLGGALGNAAFQAHRLCSGVGCAFGTRSFGAENPGTIGIMAAALVNDTVEVRFEAMRQRFAYQIRYDLVTPFEQHSVSSTSGHFWQYPVLVTYRFHSRPVRPFVGGGLNVTSSGSYVTETQSTTITPSSNGAPVTTTDMQRRSFRLQDMPAFYIGGGLEGKIGALTIRPELRYRRSPSNSNSAATVVPSPNQFEFLLGFSARLFRFK